jgi:hypothetical protein
MKVKGQANLWALLTGTTEKEQKIFAAATNKKKVLDVFDPDTLRLTFHIEIWDTNENDIFMYRAYTPSGVGLGADIYDMAHNFVKVRAEFFKRKRKQYTAIAV